MPPAVRVTDIVSCTDIAIQGSPDVITNGLRDHRVTDDTGGHGCWPPNFALTGSPDVIINGLGKVRKDVDKHRGHACIGFHQLYYATGSPDRIVN